MKKKLKIPTRSFGSEVEDPSVTSLADWVSSHRGKDVDLTSYKLEQSLLAQKIVDIPSVGGIFYFNRWLEAIDGISERVLIKEPDTIPTNLVGDAAMINSLRKDVWFSIPAPHQLNLSDAYYGDTEEFHHAIYSCYHRLMRGMRDIGSYGHVLLCTEIFESELEELAKYKTFFYDSLPNTTKLSLLLEYQNLIAIDTKHLQLALNILSEYDIKNLIILNPTLEALQTASHHMDHEKIMVGGYCHNNCSEYWDDLISKAYLSL